MKMKIMLSMIAALVCATSLMAQRPTIGLRAGVNFQTLTGKYEDGDKFHNDILPGFNVGVNAEIPVGIDFYVQPGVLFSTKGAKLKDADAKVNIGYLEVPVNFLFKPEVGTGHVLLGFGPYIGFGLTGKVNPETGGDEDINFKNDLTTAEALSGDPYLKSLDAGANFLFGYETSSKFSVQLNAGLGLVDIQPKVEGKKVGKSKTNNTGFGVSVGYRF